MIGIIVILSQDFPCKGCKFMWGSESKQTNHVRIAQTLGKR